MHDITTCNTEEPQKKYHLERSVKYYVGLKTFFILYIVFLPFIYDLFAEMTTGASFARTFSFELKKKEIGL